MDEHAVALVQWAGPTVLSVFGVVICVGLRAVFLSLRSILQRNENEHQRMFECLREQDRYLHEQELRRESLGRKIEDMAERESRRDDALHEQGERLTRVEVRVESAENDIVQLKNGRH